MHLFPRHPRIPASILAALVLPLALGCATASADPVRVRGSVVSLDGAKLVVRAKDGKIVRLDEYIDSAHSSNTIRAAHFVHRQQRYVYIADLPENPMKIS